MPIQKIPDKTIKTVKEWQIEYATKYFCLVYTDFKSEDPDNSLGYLTHIADTREEGNSISLNSLRAQGLRPIILRGYDVGGTYVSNLRVTYGVDGDR